MADNLVVGGSRVAVLETVGHFDQTLADPGPQLVGGGAGEGDDQQLGRRDVRLGEEPGGQVGQGIGLSGAGAGLDGQSPTRKGAVDLEGNCGAEGHDAPAGMAGAPVSGIGSHGRVESSMAP